VERDNGYFGASFLPGRTFASAAQFNTQLAGWLPKADGRLVRSTGRRPDEPLDADLTALPRFLRRQGLRTRIRPAGDYITDPGHVAGAKTLRSDFTAAGAKVTS
jgi:hypothetical protein